MAKYWYKKAADQGDRYAKDALDVLSDIEEGYVQNPQLKQMLRGNRQPSFIDTNNQAELEARISSMDIEELLDLMGIDSAEKLSEFLSTVTNDEWEDAFGDFLDDLL